MTPMTPQRRFGIVLTVLILVAVAGFVVGCDSDDTPTVTPPSGSGTGTTPTRNMTAEQQGREGLKETDGGRSVSNTGEVALNVRFNYDAAASGSGVGVRSTHTTARHYRLNVGAVMPSDPADTGTVPTRFACAVPATARANGQCFDNDRSEIQSPPTSYGGTAWPGAGAAPPFDLSFEGFGFPEQKVRSGCLVREIASDGQASLRNNCGTAVSVLTTCPAEFGPSYPGLPLGPFKEYTEVSVYDSLQNFRRGRTAKAILDEWVEEPRTADALRFDGLDEEYERRVGVAASAFSYYSHITTRIAAGQTLNPYCGASGLQPYHACYVREESMVKGAYPLGTWAYFPGAKTVDIIGEWSCFIGHTGSMSFVDRFVR